MKKQLGIYVHIPFCKRKCAYCDFLSFATTPDIQTQYVEKLIEEIKKCELPYEAEVATVFFGGGTPSILEAEQIAKVMDTLRKKFAFAANPEITLEANPGTVTEEKLKAYRQAGINRLSLGLQSVHSEELQLLGRIHTYGEFVESFTHAREMGFSNINVDLMSALPGQSPETWRETLQRVVALEPEHISAYSLIIEEGTPFYERYGEDAKRRENGEDCQWLPSEEAEREMYYDTARILAEAGYHRYEISNYARKGYESRHNSSYWKRIDYRGFGLGASSLVENTRFRNTTEMQDYLAGDYAAYDEEKLTVEAQMEETMFLGLRMREGVGVQKFEEKFGTTMEQVYGKVLKKLYGENLLQCSDGRIYLTEKGIDVSNYVLSEFLL